MTHLRATTSHDTRRPEAFTPLDPLTAAEIAASTAAIRSAERFRELAGNVRFITIELRAPDKQRVIGWTRDGGTPPTRESFVVLLAQGDGSTHEVVVSLDAGEIVSWTSPEGVQPLAVVHELTQAEDLVRDDPEFRAALAKRGVEDFDSIQIDAWPGGNYGRPEEQERRLARCIAFVKPTAGASEWAHPVDGLIALVDLNTLELLWIEDHGVVPIPPESGDFDVASVIETVGELRDDIAPLEISQPDGPGFTVEGNVVEWQRWRFHVGFTPREGLVISQLRYHDQGRLRSVLYRASLSEMVVPYGDPSPTHYFKNAFDLGENGVGVAASTLRLGCDCLGEIHYFDATVSDAEGNPVSIPNAICMHEEDHGVLWRHIEWRTGQGEVRRSRRLVISSFSAIGNYDYGFFWYLSQDGTITFEVKLTGVLSTGAVPPGERPRHGVLVAPQLNAMVHQHYFNMRLDLDVDGTENTVEEVTSVQSPPGPDNPHRNAWEVRRRPLRRESEGRRDVDLASARWWEVVNPRVRNRLDEPVAFRLVPGANAKPLAHPDAAVIKRAAFITDHLWVTPYRADERYAAGEYPNQHAGGAGLPEWTAADREIEATDVVLWYSFGHHHVPRPEDWPVMPVVTIGFSLTPSGFFERNPALDIPPPEPTPDHCAAPEGAPEPEMEPDR